MIVKLLHRVLGSPHPSRASRSHASFNGCFPLAVVGCPPAPVVLPAPAPVATCAAEGSGSSSLAACLPTAGASASSSCKPAATTIHGPGSAAAPCLFSNMAGVIKTMVSKKKHRYKGDGYNLDLTYITDRLIAMGSPAQKVH